MQFYAKDIMSSQLITIKPEMMCEDAVELFIANRISGAPVVDVEKNLIGVMSIHDILLNSGNNIMFSSNYFEEAKIDRILAEEGLHLDSITEGFVSDYMKRDVFTALPDTEVEELATIMFKNRIHRVIITTPDKDPIGIVTTFDLLKLIAGHSLKKEVETV